MGTDTEGVGKSRRVIHQMKSDFGPNSPIFRIPFYL